MLRFIVILLSKKIIIFPLIACFLILGLSLDQIGYQAISFIVLTSALTGIILAPIQLSLLIVTTFIWFQGFFKIVSNYHPFIHLGADVVVIALLFKILFKQNEIYKKAPPFTWLFAVHFCWIFIILFNPYSLSLASNIAGAKIYVSMFLLYFFGYYFVNSLKEVKKIFMVFISLSAVQTVFTIYQGLKGPSSVLSLHSGYQVQLAKLGSYAFRPFGLTHVPGGPSVYIYVTLPFLIYFIFFSKINWLRLASALLLPLMGVALFLCQVRSAIIKAIVALFIFVVALGTSHIKVGVSRRFTYILGSASLAVLSGLVMYFILGYSVESYEDNEMAIERSLSTFDVDSMKIARRGNWDRFVKYATEVPFGAGFSRVGAAAGAFTDLQKGDPYFTKGHFFSDNLFILLVIEIGIPGFLIVTTLLLGILFFGYKIWRTETREELIGPQMAIWSSLVAIAIGSYGAEGIVYNPESGFFWLFAGIMMAMNDSGFNKSIDLKAS